MRARFGGGKELQHFTSWGGRERKKRKSTGLGGIENGHEGRETCCGLRDNKRSTYTGRGGG